MNDKNKKLNQRHGENRLSFQTNRSSQPRASFIFQEVKI